MSAIPSGLIDHGPREPGAEALGLSQNVPSGEKAARTLTIGCLLLVLGWLWFGLIRHLSPEWTLNEQYQYGWSVPVLMIILLVRRALGKIPNLNPLPKPSRQDLQTSEKYHTSSSDPKFGIWAAAWAFFLVYAAIRLIQEANPEWRFVSWTFALLVLGVTIALSTRLTPRWRHFLYPLCFFLVAVPWPTIIEGPLVQELTRLSTAATVEVLGWFGIPAMPQGNVIELSTGVVGIDEACSGIRSLQAALMLALFFGEWHMLSRTHRVILVGSAFLLSLAFNLGRTLLLVSVAAKRGVDAMARWHDPAGTVILLGCFIGLWGLSSYFHLRQKRVSAADGDGVAVPPRVFIQGLRKRVSAALGQFASAPGSRGLALGLFFAVALAEIAVEAWYRSHAAHRASIPEWSVNWPTDNPTFRVSEIPKASRRILRFDEGADASWSEEGARWQAIALRWNAGRTALHLAQGHTPDVCLTAAGHKLDSASELKRFEVNGLQLPFRCYTVTDAAQQFYVFYCLWDDRTVNNSFGRESLTYGTRLGPVLAGLRNPGQRSLEIAVWGFLDQGSAEAALARELRHLISVANVRAQERASNPNS